MVRSPRKKLDWTVAQIGATLSSIVGGGSAKLSAYALDPTTARDFYTSPTLMATRMAFTAFIGPGLLTTNLTPAFLGVGLIRWDDIDNAPPTAADTPGPLTNGDLDWILRIISPIPAGTPGGLLLGQPLDKVYESAARRKLENTSGLLACFELTTTPGTGVQTASIGVDVRMLLKQV